MLAVQLWRNDLVTKETGLEVANYSSFGNVNHHHFRFGTLEDGELKWEPALWCGGQ